MELVKVLGRGTGVVSPDQITPLLTTGTPALREWYDRTRARRLALPSNQLEALGSALGHSNERFLGGPRSAARRCPAALLEANPDMASVLADVETVVGTFHRARAIRRPRR